MPNYDIVEFYYDRLSDDESKSKEKVKQAILDNDAKGTAASWINNSKSDWFTKDYEGKKLKEKVDTENSAYITTMKANIEAANAETINDITIDNEYEDATVTELEEFLDDRRETFATIVVEIEGEEFEIPEKFSPGRPKSEVSQEVQFTAGQIMESIVVAGDSNDLETLQNIRISHLPSDLKKFLERERRETIASVQEELREGEQQTI